MGQHYFLGVDVGTGESKGALCDAAGGIAARAVRPHAVIRPQPDYAEHDPNLWWDEFGQITAELMEAAHISPEQIKGVCCSAVACGLTAVAGGKPLRNAILYGIDSRSLTEIEEMEHRLGKEKIREFCDCDLSVDSFGPKMLWIKNNEPELYKEAESFTVVQGFLNYKLTGNNCTDIYTAGWAQPFFNRRTCDWEPELYDGFITPEKLPSVAWSSSVIGEITRQAARETGLLAGTPVVCGTTDAGAEAVSIGVANLGDLMVTFGSTAFMIQIVPPDARGALPVNNFLFPGTGCVVAGTATAGALVKWIGRQFAKELFDGNEADPYGKLLAGAGKIPPGSDGVYVLPYFAGERTPINDPEAKGLIMGLRLEHTRDHVVRAAIEGIGYGIRRNAETMETVGGEPRKVLVAGGGAKSEAWMQIVSDMLGRELQIPEVTMGAAYGDAMLAAMGTGYIENGSVTGGWAKVRKRMEPDFDVKSRYDKNIAYFEKLYDANREIMHEI